MKNRKTQVRFYLSDGNWRSSIRRLAPCVRIFVMFSTNHLSPDLWWLASTFAQICVLKLCKTLSQCSSLLPRISFIPTPKQRTWQLTGQSFAAPSSTFFSIWLTETVTSYSKITASNPNTQVHGMEIKIALTDNSTTELAIKNTDGQQRTRNRHQTQVDHDTG